MDNKYTQAWTTLVFSLASSSPLCVASLRRWRFSPAVGLFCGQKVTHFIPIINEETSQICHLSSGCIIMTVLWPITRSDRTETLNGQSTSIIYNRATSLGVQNKEFVAVSQTDYTSSDAVQAKK